MRNASTSRCCLLLLAATCALLSPVLAAPPYRLVAAAPGYPGTPAGAQPTMDLLARRVATAAGLAEGVVSAEYVPDEHEGVARIADPETGLALVPLPMFLKYEEHLGLLPLVQAVGRDGSGLERWSLVAPAGKVSTPGDLAGWEVVGIPAYAEAFVRGPLLGEWGALPDDTRVVFTGRVLGALRRMADGEQVAALLDAEQVAALPSLPGADAYEVVHTSTPLPSAVVAAVRGRLTEEEIRRLRDGLMALSAQEASGELLATLRLRGFEPVDVRALEAARDALAAADRAPLARREGTGRPAAPGRWRTRR